MKRSTKIIIPIAVLALGFLAMTGLLSLRTETPKRAPEIRPKQVETAVVSLQSLQASIIAYGRVATGQPVKLYAEAAGTLELGDVPFRDAQSFSRGDLLLKIDDRQTRLELNSLKSDLLTALANVLPEIKVAFPAEYDVWQEYFDSCQFDREIELIPETGNRQIRMYLSRFNVYRLYFAIRKLEIALEKHYISAPFNGSIVSTELRPGSTARTGSLLGEIINLEELEVAVSIEAGNIRWLDTGEAVRLTSSEMPGEWIGHIVRIGSEIDRQTQTVDLFLSVDGKNVDPLLNGTFLQARLGGGIIDSAFAVPIQAVYDEKFVYLIDDGLLVRREVEIARRETDIAIVSDGLQDGDTLVVEIMQGVAPGMPAKPKVVFSGEERD